MSKIVDQFGKPIVRAAALDDPQTSRVSALQNRYLTPMLSGLTPATLATALAAADNGNLIAQHRLFADMEERDAHIQAEMAKRKNAVTRLAWSIVPPRNANAAEKAAAEWVSEMLQDATDPIQDLFVALMDAVGHGFAPVELEWRQEGSTWLPTYHPRPQEWLQMNQARTEFTLSDGSVDGAPLRPFGWMMHTGYKAKTGYLGRMGLYRTLVWPFLYKAYALGDFAEYLETYGLPIIMGKYFSGASADEKASLMRAVTALGHDARAIMPEGMTIDINNAGGATGGAAHLVMVNWADKSQSKSILGQTLSADTGEGGGGSYALGKVHNEVRQDIAEGDALQLSGTITRDLIYPMVALNRPGINGLARCPRLVFDCGEPEDLKAYAESLPKLIGVGFKIPRPWAQERLHIPEPQEGEEILAVVAPAPAATASSNPAAPAKPATAALSAVQPSPAEIDPTAGIVDQLGAAAAPVWADQIAAIGEMVSQADSLAALQVDLLAKFGGQPDDQLVKLMAAAFALAELSGMADVKRDS